MNTSSSRPDRPSWPQKEEKLKQQLLALKDTEIEGKLARVTITEAEGRLTYDADLLKAHVSAKILTLCQKRGNRFIRFGVKARIAV